MLTSITFLESAWLWLLLLIPIVFAQSYRSLSGLGKTRQAIAIALRSLVLILICFALADMQWVKQTEGMCTLFVLDHSQSLPPAKSEAALSAINKAIRERKNDQDMAGLVVFGKESKLELPPAQYPRDRVIRGVGSILDRQYTDLASAMQLALGSFPPDCARRLVVFSDGNQNQGDALAQAALAKTQNVPVDIIPLEYRYDSEILVDKIVLPPDLRKGDTANLKVVIRSARPAAGVLRVIRIAEGKRETILEQRVDLREGINVFTRQETMVEPNFYTYEAQFEPSADAGDQLARNNYGTGYVFIRGEGRVLLIHPPGNPPATFMQKLRADGLQVTARTSEQIGSSLAELRQYDSVVIQNVPAEQLTEKVQEAIAANTRELGAGLVMIGGTESFGAGGYLRSPLEKALPVDMDVKSLKIRGKGALVLIMHASEIPEGNFWQKKIGKLAVGTLGSQDECGLLYWNGTSAWLFSLQPVRDGNMMKASIDRMVPGDMPDFDSALSKAVNSLSKSDAMYKHTIVISDGDPSPPSLSVLSAFSKAKVTCSTVAVAAHGSMERTVMRDLAKKTGGRFYEANNPETLPEIYIKETRVVARPLIFEKTPGWTPRLSAPTEPVAGLPSELPAIKGFVLTTPKPAVDVPIQSPLPADNESNPILAHWQYGLGRSVAFTSDLGEKWAGDWAASPLYGKFWSQLVRWSLRPNETENLTLSTLEKDGVVSVVVNAIDKATEYLNFLELKGKVIRPDLKEADVEFKQTEPGKYEAKFKVDSAGTYMLRLGYRQPNGKYGVASTALSVAYPAEYRDTESHRDILENIAQITGGRVIEEREMMSTDFFTHDQAPSRRMTAIWPILLLSALSLFFLDVANRRIAVEFRDIRWAAARVWAFVVQKPIAAPVVTMDRLRSAKAEASAELTKRRYETKEISTSLPDSADVSTKDKPISKSTTDASTPSLAPKPETSAEDASYTSRLLKAKRKTWDERGEPSDPPAT